MSALRSRSSPLLFVVTALFLVMAAIAIHRAPDPGGHPVVAADSLNRAARIDSVAAVKARAAANAAHDTVLIAEHRADSTSLVAKTAIARYWTLRREYDALRATVAVPTPTNPSMTIGAVTADPAPTGTAVPLPDGSGAVIGAADDAVRSCTNSLVSCEQARVSLTRERDRWHETADRETGRADKQQARADSIAKAIPTTAQRVGHDLTVVAVATAIVYSLVHLFHL